MLPLEASSAALASLNRDPSDANSTPESAHCRHRKTANRCRDECEQSESQNQRTADTGNGKKMQR